MNIRKALTIISLLLLCANLALWLRIQPVKAVGTVYIKPDGTVDPPETPIQKTGNNYLFTSDISASIIVQKSYIVLDGAGHLLQGSGIENGVDLSGLTDVTVMNTVIKTFDYGIYVFSSTNINISGNTIINNNGGIWLKESTNNFVGGNLIKENYLDGIYIWSSSSNTIFQNNVEDNVYGISPYYCSDDRIYHNNFVNNTVSVNPNEPADFWDQGYPAGGNYWSDYAGSDANNDGIGDTPYTIDTNNSDNYPLKQPWQPPDIAVTYLQPYKTVFPSDFPLNLNVTVGNEGNKIEGFNITAYANTTLLKQQYIILNKGSLTTININVANPENSLGLTEYMNYTIHISAVPLQGEAHIADNTMSYSSVKIVHLGDVYDFGKIDIKDVSRVSAGFGSVRTGLEYRHPTPCTNCPHTPNADINNDGKVDIKDLARTSSNYGWHIP